MSYTPTGTNVPRGVVTLFSRLKWQEKKMTETQEQKTLVQWCRRDSRFQYLFHIPNESIGGQGWIVRNRQMGVKSGVPDLFYPVPMHGYHGLFIEMKTRSGRVDKNQTRWIQVLTDFGYKAVVAHGWEEARNALLEYIGEGQDDNLQNQLS